MLEVSGPKNHQQHGLWHWKPRDSSVAGGKGYQNLTHYAAKKESTTAPSALHHHSVLMTVAAVAQKYRVTEVTGDRVTDLPQKKCSSATTNALVCRCLLDANAPVTFVTGPIPEVADLNSMFCGTGNHRLLRLGSPFCEW